MLGGMMQSIGVGGTVEAGEMNVSWLTFDNSNERLGIGTASPSAELHIQGAADSHGSIYLTDGDSTGISNSLLIRVSGSNASIYNRKADATLRLGTNDQFDIFKIIGTGTPATNTMVLDEGNVGIGTASPDYVLDVNGSFGFTPGTSVTPASNGDVVIEATNNTTLTFKLKGTDSTVRSGTITLS